jgi:hypothetical protein
MSLRAERSGAKQSPLISDLRSKEIAASLPMVAPRNDTSQ